MFASIFVLVTLLATNACHGKYIDGHLQIKDNWAFLARFCFLSENGLFEYQVDFDGSQGTPNLLLYYDTEDQWPSVYKTDTTCVQKEAVLKIDNNQIINLTTQFPHNQFSGCTYKVVEKSTQSPEHDKAQADLKPHDETTSTTLKKLLNQSRFDSIDLSHDNLTTIDSSLVEIFTQAPDNDTLLEQGNYTQHVNLTKRSLKYTSTNNHQLTVTCHNARRFQSARERWWFIAVSNCHHNKGIDIKYKLLMTNGAFGDFWHYHFSADEFFVLPMLLVFDILYAILFLMAVVCAIELKSRQLLHASYKLFMWSVFFELFGILLRTLATINFASTGEEKPRLKRTGVILNGYSEICFLLLLVLLAKGFTITRARLSNMSVVKLTVFMCFYTMTYFLLFIYEKELFDPGKVTYLFESPAGHGLIILRFFAWFMFELSCVTTLKRYPEKSNFYYPFNICGTLWFVSGPILVILGNSHIDKWVRESIVTAVMLAISFVGHVMFFILTLPSYNNKNFPYHIRTTQIGIMMGHNVDNFQHHAYEPSDASVIVPLSKRTEQLFSAKMPASVPTPVSRSAQPPVPVELFTVTNTTLKYPDQLSVATNGFVASPSAPHIVDAPAFSAIPVRLHVDLKDENDDDKMNNVRRWSIVGQNHHSAPTETSGR